MARSADSKLIEGIRNHGRMLAVAGVVGAVGLGGFVSIPDAALESRSQDDAAVVEVVTADATGAPSWDLPNLDHPRVDYWVERFQTVPEMREKFEGFLVRSGWFHDMISAKLAERGMPQDLVYLAMIESGFQPTAYSPAAASGIWQFISETGRRYGLEIDASVDERNHPEKATDAALDYLSELHERFGSWYLSAAAYNTGEGRIGRIMREEFGTEKAFGEGAYYRIWDRLPRETRDYVPLMIAAGRIAKEPAKYGFDHVTPEPALAYEEVMTDASLTMAQVARAAGTDEREIERLNPHFKQGRLPGDRRVAVRLPPGSGDDFEKHWPEFVGETTVAAVTLAASAEAAPARAKTKTSATYRVRAGDNLTAIARRHGMTVKQVRSLNGLRSDRIYAGQTLKVAAR